MLPHLEVADTATVDLPLIDAVQAVNASDIIYNDAISLARITDHIVDTGRVVSVRFESAAIVLLVAFPPSFFGRIEGVVIVRIVVITVVTPLLLLFFLTYVTLTLRLLIMRHVFLSI